MLKLNLAGMGRGEVRLGGSIPVDDPLWSASGLTPAEPLTVELAARSVGAGVFVRGAMRTRLMLACRRCLKPVSVPLDEKMDLLFQDLMEENGDGAGEVYPIPPKALEIDLTDAVREQLLLRLPRFVLCMEECSGLCPRCGADLNQAPCACAPVETLSSWSALKQVKFD